MLFTAKVWCRQAGYRRLNMVEAVSYTGSRNPGRGIGWSRSQRRKSEVMCGRSRSGRPYPLRQAPSPQDFPFPLDLYPIARQEGIQREKVWSCPMRQDRAVHRRSEACMAGAQLASLPWLTVDLSGFPPPFPPPFPFGCS
nr:MAG TPA: hypothetical protein [Caudoviricetes sp.]